MHTNRKYNRNRSDHKFIGRIRRLACTGADLVEMEGARWATAAWRRGLPFVSLRVISAPGRPPLCPGAYGTGICLTTIPLRRPGYRSLATAL